MRPLYARALRLRHTTPSGSLCFAYFEGAIILAVLLALAERVSWWGVLVLPALIALWVKFYDVVAGVAERRREIRQAREFGATAGRRAVARYYAQAGPATSNAYPTDRQHDEDARRARQ